MIQTRNYFLQTRRDAWVEVDLGAIEHNVKILKKLANGTKFMAVVKADAYGHGAPMVAQTLSGLGVDMLGVASIDEALNIKDAKVEIPILVLGVVPDWAIETAVKNDVAISIFNESHLKLCRKVFSKLNKKPKVHIKINTGMNRIGVSAKEAVGFIQKVKTVDFLEFEGVFSHLACAEDKEKTKVQLNLVGQILNQVQNDIGGVQNDTDNSIIFHVLNTAGLMNFSKKSNNMVRCGIGIYGLMPELKENIDINLKQAIGLKGRITNLQTLEAGEGISYSHSYKTTKKTKVATIPIGYADGVPRNLSNKIYGILDGKKVPQIGNITMDQMMFDVTGVKANGGDIITLLGRNKNEFISVNEWAKILDTINYEITCLLKTRLVRVYKR